MGDKWCASSATAVQGDQVTGICGATYHMGDLRHSTAQWNVKLRNTLLVALHEERQHLHKIDEGTPSRKLSALSQV